MVEGVGYKPGAPGLDDPTKGVWWGENLAGAALGFVAVWQRWQMAEMADGTIAMHSNSFQH